MPDGPSGGGSGRRFRLEPLGALAEPGGLRPAAAVDWVDRRHLVRRACDDAAHGRSSSSACCRWSALTVLASSRAAAESA